MLPLTSSVFFVGSPAPHLHKATAWDETRQPNGGRSPSAPLAGSATPSSTPTTATPQSSSSSAVPISSIPRHVAVIMLKHYCEIYRPQYPAVEEHDLLQAFDRVYDKTSSSLSSSPTASDFDVFCVHITLAISTTTLMYRDAGRAATATAGFWATAVSHLDALDRASVHNPWQRVQALQLLAHYGFLNPKDVDCVRCTAAALRLCVQLGVHHELPEDMRRNVDDSTLNIRRRLFWHALSLDLAANSTRGRPASLRRHDFTAKMPTLGASSPTAHVWALRQMEGQILDTLYYPSNAMSPDGLDTWHSDIRTRLTAWHQATRQSVALAETLEFAEILFHMQRLRLSRPSPRRPNPTPAQQSECLAAAVAVLRAFDVIARLGKLFYIWHAAHCVVEAATCLCAAILTAVCPNGERTMSEARTQEEVVSVSDVPILTRHLKTFPGILWKMARRWPAVAHHAAALERISQAVVERLQLWAANPEAELSEGTVALKQKLKDMSLFSPFPEEPTVEQTVDTPPVDVNITAPFDANWTLPPLSPNEVLAVSASTTSTMVDPGSTFGTTDDSVLDWDFAGVGFEEIFSALIQANHTEEEATTVAPDDMLA
ncbi:hypothetical protein Sste5346_008275 [Sporothrix stenoceras]|uniref:Xylanolytic transcriptional activator regulatory domain-containing protein n=1 Tax=Sporothrix stenoceras TaxID=5173 RepID=A0ABR3YQS6_9PEZI